MGRRAWVVTAGFLVLVLVWAAVNLYIDLNRARLGDTDTAVLLIRVATWSAYWLPWAMLASPMFVLLYLGLVGVLTQSGPGEPVARKRLVSWTGRATAISAIAWLCFLLPAVAGSFSTALAWLSWGVAILGYGAATASALLIQTEMQRQGHSRLGKKSLLAVSLLAAVIPFWSLLLPLSVYLRARRVLEIS